MKALLKSDEPDSLRSFRRTAPTATWQEMKDDPAGKAAYDECRQILLDDQGGLCAFCEIDIRDNDPLKCRVEHFHAKSDTTSIRNWALDWENLCAVCNGGSLASIAEPGFFHLPLDDNLSCDSFKNRMIQKNKLPIQCAGWILNPLRLCATPTLFMIRYSSGELQPHVEHCRAVWIDGNRFNSTEELVQNTITLLNLNCDRLKEARLRVIRHLEHEKKRLRSRRDSREWVLETLARRFLQTRWPMFFTTVRCCLGAAAESYLLSIDYQG